MTQPLNTYKFKGLQLADWGSGRFSIRKSYKAKGSDTWTEHKIPTLFREELIELEKLIHEALSQPIQEAKRQGVLDSLPPVNSKFDDSDDLPF